MTFWFLSEQFRSLTVAGKIAVVGGYVLVLLIVMLWATCRTKK